MIALILGAGIALVLTMVAMPKGTNFYSAIVLPVEKPYLGRG